jgi:glycosyltransferase involved in cell wall biosynthesis
MRVLIIPSFYPTVDEPNRGVFFQKQAEACVRDDVEIHVLYYELRSLKKIKSFTNWSNIFQTRASRENSLFVYRCHAWNLIPTKYKLGRKIWVKASYRLFEQYIKSYGLPDVIHVQSAFEAANLAYQIKQKYNIPYFINEHSTRIKLGSFSDKELISYKKLFDNAYCVVAVSKSLKTLIAEKFSVNGLHIQVIPNFINTDFFLPIYQNHTNDHFTFLTVCFLEKKKRVERLVDAFYTAFKNDDTVRLIIGGEGPERAHITDKIANYNLQDKVKLLGALSQTRVRDEMRFCDCFVLPSDVETFGVVLIEAMSIGKPVISTISGGPENFINDKVGLIVQRDLHAIANALITIKNNPEKFNRTIIRNYILENFSSKVVSDKVVKLYKEIAGVSIPQ